MHKSLKVCKESLRKWQNNPRIWAILCLIFLFEWVLIGAVREICIQKNLSISCWYFPFLFQNTINNLFFYFGILLLFCDAPFTDKQQMYVILRCGKQNWFLGKIMYLFLSCCIYFFIMFIVSILEFIPYIGFSFQWEDIINQLTLSNIFTNMPRSIIVQYTPLEAVSLTYVMCVLVAFFLGLVIFYLNLSKWHNLGTMLALVLILMPGLANALRTDYKYMLQYLLPVSWTNISLFVKDYGGIPLSYALTFLGIAIVMFIVLIMRQAKSYNIEAMEEL